MRGSISKAIVFFSSCESVEYHYKTLRWLAKGGKGKMEDDDDSVQGPYEIFRLHGLLCQSERTNVFRNFATTKAGVLLCTDVGARGLDFVGVGATVKSILPPTPRRTCIASVEPRVSVRMAKPCSFYNPRSANTPTCSPTRASPSPTDPPSPCSTYWTTRRTPPNGINPCLRACPISIPPAQRMQKKLLAKVASDKPCDVLAKDAFRAHVRAYATFPSKLKHIFHVKRLHLGHVAAAFGLKDAPQLIGASATKAALPAQGRRRERDPNPTPGAPRKNASPSARKSSPPRPASALPIGTA